MHGSRRKVFVALLLALVIIITWKIKSSIKDDRRGKSFQNSKKVLKVVDALLPNDVVPSNVMSISLDMFAKQISRAERFERSNILRETMMEVLSGVKSLKVIETNKSIPFDKYTLVLNAIKEIHNIDTVLSDLKTISKEANWVQEVKILIGISEAQKKKHEIFLKEIETILPNMKWSVASDNIKTLSGSLTFLINQVDTENIIVTRSVHRFRLQFSMLHFLEPLHKKSCDIIGGATYSSNKTFNLGCYQSKLIWSQYKVQHGYDVIGDLIKCDSIDGPFATNKTLLLNHLKKKPGIEDGLVYVDFFYSMTNNNNKIIKLCPACIFHVDDEYKSWTSSRNAWLKFVKQNEISEVVVVPPLPVNNGVELKHAFKNNEVGQKCPRRAGMLKPRSCMQDLHDMLIESYKLFDKFGLQYTNSDGSAIGATKLAWTLPWDLDQDMEFRSQNFSELVKHASDFSKIGIRFGLELNHPCLTTKTTKWTCGYVGLSGPNCRLEAWGQYILVSDFFNPERLPERFRKLNMLPPTRIIGNATLVQMGDHWSPNRPNPGLYGRARYGIDILKHAKHWMDGGATVSMGLYATATRFQKCPVVGHHECLDQYLSDGNIQFKKVWA